MTHERPIDPNGAPRSATSSEHLNGQVGDAPDVVAALYVAGALPEEDADVVERRLARNETSDPLVAAVRALDDCVRSLGDHPEATPPASVREELMTRVEQDAAGRTAEAGHLAGHLADHLADHLTDQVADDDDGLEPVWRRWSDGESEQPSLYTLHADEGAWEETGIDGIEVRRLFVDEANNRMTAMFRMAPGTSYVPHRHDAPEECYVLQGDLHVADDCVLRAGDYQRASADSLHGVQWTEEGCVLLISCSLHDEQFYDEHAHG